MPNNEAERENRVCPDCKQRLVIEDGYCGHCRQCTMFALTIPVSETPVPPTESGEVPYSPNHAIYIGNLKKRIVEVEDANETLHDIAARRIGELVEVVKECFELEDLGGSVVASFERGHTDWQSKDRIKEIKEHANKALTNASNLKG